MDEWKYVGEVAVDAGLVMVGDPCYAKDKDHPIHKWSKFCDLVHGDHDNSATQLKFKHGGPGLGVVVSSGYGDGVYPVYVKHDERGCVAEMKVVFVSDDEDDDDLSDSAFVSRGIQNALRAFANQH